MKTQAGLLASALCLAVALFAYAADEKSAGKTEMQPVSVKAERFLTLDPVVVHKPLFPDSAAAADFSKDDMLKYGFGGDFTTVAEGTTFPIDADTAGILHLKRVDSLDSVADNEAAVRRLFTKIKAERFAKGNLKLNTKLPHKIYAAGKELKGNEKYPLRLEPQRVIELEIRLLQGAKDAEEEDVEVSFVPDSEFEDVAVELSPSLRSRFSISTITGGKRVGNSYMSPDGNYLIAGYSQQYSKDNTVRHRELIDLRTRQTINGDIPSGYFWMPRETFRQPTLAYTVKKNGTYDLMAAEVPSMKSTLYAKGLPDKDFTISNDGSYIIYSTKIDGPKKEGTMVRYANQDDRMPGNSDRYYLNLYDLKSGVSRPLTHGGASDWLLDISPDSKRILISSTVEIPDRYPFYDSRLVELDITTMKADTLLVNDNSSLSSAVYSPDGSRLFCTAGPNSFGNIGVNAGDHEIANDFDIQGFIFDLNSKTAKAVTRDFDPSISGEPVWNRADGKIYFRAESGFGCYIYCLDPKTGKILQLETTPDYAASMAMGLYADKIAYRGMSYTTTGNLYLLNTKNDKVTALLEPMNETLDRLNFGEWKDWKFTASDGTVIDGTYTLPPDFDPAKKYPMIVYYYGGTTPCTKTMTSPYTPQLLASRGYVVYILNPSGTIGYGQEFSARHVNAWGKRTAEDIIEGVKQFCKEHDFVDSKKIGCMGASYGGFMTQYLQTLTDIFACAVSHAGISNVTSYWGEGYWGYSYNVIAAAKSYPWNNPDLFTRQGSLFNADKIHTPLLLLHGTVDTNVPIGESIQLFNALKILGRDVEFITVDDENHIISDYDKRILWHETIMAWFAKYLQDDPRWWKDLYK